MAEVLSTPITVTFNADQWAKIVAVIANSPLELDEKDFLNSAIYRCVLDG